VPVENAIACSQSGNWIQHKKNADCVKVMKEKDRYTKCMSRGKKIKNDMTIFISMASYI